jgi:DNA-binding response OmpR family regulator
MKGGHCALIIEDEEETALDLQQILNSLDCYSVRVTNVEDATRELETGSFCLVLLDLEIKSEPDGIKGHLENGKALLRKIRQMHFEHNGLRFWLPVLVISGFAHERDEALELMKDGATDVIEKPIDGKVSQAIRKAFAESRRETHDLCQNHPVVPRDNFKEKVVVTISGERAKRRTTIRLGSQPVTLTAGSLRVLLQLVLSHLQNKQVHKTDLGANHEQGFKGISILRGELKQILGDTDIIENHYHGNYGLLPSVAIGEIAFEELLKLDDVRISSLVEKIRKEKSLPGKSEGNSQKFPSQRRRR